MHRGFNLMTVLAIAGTVILPFAPAAAGQDTEVPDDDAARQRRAAEIFEDNARILTLFDQNGKVTGTVGDRAIYFAPSLSPDGERIAVVINDPFEEIGDLWVFDIDSGDRVRITSNAQWDSEWAGTPVWSPDGRELAYVALRDGYEGIYRKAASGEGEEQLVYRHPGARLWLGDWSIDGRLLSVSTTNLAESYLYVLPLDDSGEIRELLHRDSRFLMAGSFSPDNRYLSYRSRENGVNEIYLWDLDEGAGGRQVSEAGGLFQFRGPWNTDDNEIYYLAPGERVMAAVVGEGDASVEVKPLFDLSVSIRPGPPHTSISRDGQRILIAVPHTPMLEQIAVFDRDGNVVQCLGEPGVWRSPVLSPDGTKVAVRAWMKETSNWDIWTFDLESGDGMAVTDDQYVEDSPVWSPDGRDLTYMSLRDTHSHIIRHSADGDGKETDIFTYEPGGFMVVTDWSSDGKYVSFNDGCWGVLYIVPLAGDSDESAAMEWLRDEYLVAAARFSPDSRHIAYLSDQVQLDVFNLYIAPFDPTMPDGRVAGSEPVLVSAEDVLGMVSWRNDGRELYYLSADWEVKAVDVSTENGVVAGDPRVLFELPAPLPGEPRQWKSASADGQHFVFVLNVPVEIE